PGAERRAVGGAVVVWLLFLPLATVVGAVLTWYAPMLAGVAPELAGTVRLACGALLGAVLLGGLLAVPESVLFGMNLGYKRMELQAGLSVVGGVLTAAAAYAGLGLAGVSGAQLAIAAITGLCYWGIARAYVSWFGAGRPHRPATVRLGRAGAPRDPRAHLAVRHSRGRNDPVVEPFLRGPLGRTRPMGRPHRGSAHRAHRGANRLHTHRLEHHRRRL